jgi:hypothetical protein
MGELIGKGKGKRIAFYAMKAYGEEWYSWRGGGDSVTAPKICGGRR